MLEDHSYGPACDKNCRENAGFGTGWCHEHKENVYTTLHYLQNLPPPPIQVCNHHAAPVVPLPQKNLIPGMVVDGKKVTFTVEFS